MPKVYFEISEDEMKRILLEYMAWKLTGLDFDPKKVRIEIKSKQNYKSEWESASFRAIYEEK